VTAANSSQPVWKKIIRIVLAFWVLPPWGLWLLYRDREMTTPLKWRILIYTLLIPILALLAYTLSGVNQTLTTFGL